MRVEWGLVFELLAFVEAFVRPEYRDYYAVGRSWFERIATEVPDAASRLRSFAGGSEIVWDNLIGLATEVGPGHDIGPLADHVAGMDPHVLRLELLGRRHRAVQQAVGIERIEAAAAGNAAARRDFLRLAWPEDSAWQTGVRQLLRSSPSETQATLAALLRTVGRDLSRYLDPALPALEADAAEKREAAATQDPLDLIRSAIDSTYLPGADVKGVVLIPAFVIRPFVYYFDHADQMLFLYPVAERFTGSIAGGPQDRLARLAAAMGDRGRLRILAALREREMSLKELGEALSLPRSTLRHHVEILRGAGLVRPTQIGSGFSSYQLREEAATDLAELVEGFLHPASGAPTPKQVPSRPGRRRRRVP